MHIHFYISTNALFYSFSNKIHVYTHVHRNGRKPELLRKTMAVLVLFLLYLVLGLLFYDQGDNVGQKNAALQMKGSSLN